MLLLAPLLESVVVDVASLSVATKGVVDWRNARQVSLLAEMQLLLFQEVRAAVLNRVVAKRRW